MVYSFARVSAAETLRGAFHDKGGKRHEVPCHHNLATYVDAWINIKRRAKPAALPYSTCCRTHFVRPASPLTCKTEARLSTRSRLRRTSHRARQSHIY
jgi:hypothetical protein